MSCDWKPSQELSEANHVFSCRLYKQLLEENGAGNLFFSPFSLYTALSMSLVGTRDNTASQIRKCLGLTEDFDLHSVLPSMVELLQSTGTTTIANALFVDFNFKALPSFVQVLQNLYKADVKSMDCTKEPEQAVLSINDWVNNATNGKISKLVDGVDPNMVLMILNAVYYKSLWAKQFNSEHTTDQPFHINKNSSVDVKLMYLSGSFRVANNDSADCLVLELPYNDNRTSMLIFLPNELDGLRKIEDAINPMFVTNIMDSLTSSQEVDVYLPAMKMEHSLSLKSVLCALGVADFFTKGKANLTGISETANLYAGDVVHKSYIQVNEEGTEAAAVSGVMFVTYCFVKKLVFRADHPFLFCIVENRSRIILFLGSVRNPSA